MRKILALFVLVLATVLAIPGLAEAGKTCRLLKKMTAVPSHHEQKHDDRHAKKCEKKKDKADQEKLEYLDKLDKASCCGEDLNKCKKK